MPESSPLQLDLRERPDPIDRLGHRIPARLPLAATCRSLDEKGHLRHDGGVVESPGLYALGLPVLRRRKSTFIHGIEDDARDVIDHLAGYLAGRRRRVRLQATDGGCAGRPSARPAFRHSNSAPGAPPCARAVQFKRRYRLRLGRARRASAVINGIDSPPSTTSSTRFPAGPRVQQDIKQAFVDLLDRVVRESAKGASAPARAADGHRDRDAAAARGEDAGATASSLLTDASLQGLAQLSNELTAADPAYNEREATLRDRLNVSELEHRLRGYAESVGVEYSSTDLDGILRNAGYGAAHLGSSDRYMAAVERFTNEAFKNYRERAGNIPGIERLATTSSARPRPWRRPRPRRARQLDPPHRAAERRAPARPSRTPARRRPESTRASPAAACRPAARCRPPSPPISTFTT